LGAHVQSGPGLGSLQRASSGEPEAPAAVGLATGAAAVAAVDALGVAEVDALGVAGVVALGIAGTDALGVADVTGPPGAIAFELAPGTSPCDGTLAGVLAC
jgi:hypothetical protein